MTRRARTDSIKYLNIYYQKMKQMVKDKPTIPQSTFNTTDLKLSALILSEILGSTFEIHSTQNHFKKMIKIIYSPSSKEDLDILIADYINRMARVDVFRYNRSLNAVRDKIKEES